MEAIKKHKNVKKKPKSAKPESTSKATKSLLDAESNINSSLSNGMDHLSLLENEILDAVQDISDTSFNNNNDETELSEMKVTLLNLDLGLQTRDPGNSRSEVPVIPFREPDAETTLVQSNALDVLQTDTQPIETTYLECEKENHVVLTAPTAPTLDLEPQGYLEPNSTLSNNPSVISPTEYDNVLPFSEEDLSKLYANKQLELYSEFETVLLQSLYQPEQRTLQKLLHEYVRAREALNSSEIMVRNQQLKSEELLSNLWVIERSVVTESGECQDGNPVTASVASEFANFGEKLYSELSPLLSSIRDHSNEVRVVTMLAAETARHKIHDLLRTVCNRCLDSTVVNSLEVKFPRLVEDQVNSSEVGELRNCISDLFMFYRRGFCDKNFVKDLEFWIRGLTNLLYKLATWKDYMFLLNHVLRCPPGISDWVVELIQVPDPCSLISENIENQYIDHVITTLAVMLVPIKLRDKFLEQLVEANKNREWVLVNMETYGITTDSSGGVDITEDDLLKLLSQMPLKKLFMALLKVNTAKFRTINVVTIECWNEHKLLEVFAVASSLVSVLRCGFQTYKDERYKRLAKQIAEYISNTLNHTSDLWGLYRVQKPGVTTSSPRLQCEYEALFERTVQALYSSEGLGVWQYLCKLPYQDLTQNQMWKLYYILHLSPCMVTPTDLPNNGPAWVKRVKELDLGECFETLLSAAPECEAYYLLTTYTGMALKSNDREQLFVRTVILDLFKIGFLSEATKETCCKSVRSLLSNITEHYPEYISVIVSNLRDTFDLAGDLSLYLFRDLPLRSWKPTLDDIDIIGRWLLDRHLLTSEHNLGRLILAHLNYGGAKEMFLDPSIHRRVALVVVQVVMKHAEIKPGSSPISIGSFQRNPSEVSLNVWAWDVITKVRLHHLDRDDGTVRSALANPAIMLSMTPELYDNPELELLSRGVLTSQPIACLVAVLTTTWGHSLTEIARKAFSQLEIVFRHQKQFSVISALHHISLLFLQQPEELAKCDNFISLLLGLLAADKSYLRMPKSLLSADFPGVTLLQLGNMMTHQLESFHCYGFLDPSPLIRLWLLTLSQVPGWVNEPEVIYLMNIVISYAFGYTTSHAEAKQIMRLLVQGKEPAKEVASGTLSSLLNWFTSAPYGNSLMQMASYPTAAWYAALVIEVEEERDQLLWPYICQVLCSEYRLVEDLNMDEVIQKAAKKANLASVPPKNSLAIFRWAQQALDTPFNDPLLPYLWQRFFIWYLARVPDDTLYTGYMSVQGSVGNRLFKSYFINGIRKRIFETKRFYKKKVDEYTVQYLEAPRNNEDLEERVKKTARKSYFSGMQALMRTYTLWLDDARLQETDHMLHTLPDMFRHNLLRLIIDKSTDIWYNYLDVESIRLKQSTALNAWKTTTCRVELPEDKAEQKRNRLHVYEYTLEKLINRFTMYGEPNEPQGPVGQLESILRPDLYVPLYKEDLDCFLEDSLSGESHLCVTSDRDEDGFITWTTGKLTSHFQEHLFIVVNESAQLLRTSAEAYLLRLSEHTALDCTLLELLPNLYQNKEVEVVREAVCSSSPHMSRPRHVTCAGAATIHLVVNEAVNDVEINRNIDLNRIEYSEVIRRCYDPLPSGATLSAETIKQYADYLALKFYDTEDLPSNQKSFILVRRLGVELFYYLIELYKEDMIYYPPSYEAFTHALEKLAKVFVYGDGTQTMRLLTTLLSESRLISLLSPYFAPSDVLCYKFLEMYDFIVDRVSESGQDTCFVLLTKFDIQLWLTTSTPSLIDRSSLITSIGKALTNAGLHPSDKEIMIQEVFRKHLLLMLQYSFPEHFGEIMTLLLDASNTQRLDINIWYDFINSLMGSAKIFRNIPRFRLKEEIRWYATEQNRLTHSQLVATAELLGLYFDKERLEFGLYGLYPKYRMYVDPMSIFMAMMGHSLVVATLQHDPGWLTDRLCTIIWPALLAMYSPWILPFWTSQMNEQASWIGALTNDRNAVMPWILADETHATKVVGLFSETISFILDTLPGSCNILHYVFELYAVHCAQVNVKEHIFSVMHYHLSNLAWHQFSPTVKDLELMHKVIDMFLPGSHAFIGDIFVEIPWTSWLASIMTEWNDELIFRAHICLIHLLVKLANEPTVRQKSKSMALISNSQKFAWHYLDSCTFNRVLDWWVLNSDPRVVLSLGEAYTNPIDTEVWTLLQVVAHFTPYTRLCHVSKKLKQLNYLRACMKMLMQTTSKYKTMIVQNKYSYHMFVRNQLDTMDAMFVDNEFGPEEISECAHLVEQLLRPVNNINCHSTLTEIVIDNCSEWLTRHDNTSPLLNGFLAILDTDIASKNSFATLLELAITSYFKRTVAQESTPTWADVIAIAKDPLPSNIEDALISNGSILCLHVILLKSVLSPRCASDPTHNANLLTRLMEWFKLIKATQWNEFKLPLLWGVALNLIQQQYELNINVELALRSIRIMIQLLTLLSYDKGDGWGILGTIGFGRTPAVSIRCRLLSRAIAVFLLAQLPEGGGATQAVRLTHDSLGGITQERTSPGAGNLAPSGDALKALRDLESLLTNRNYQDVKSEITLAVNLIKDSNNSLMKAAKVLGILANELYSHQFLLILNE